MQATLLTSEELNDLHNARCYLMFAVERLAKVVNPEMLAELTKVEKLIESGIGRARQESDDAEEAHARIADELDEKNKFMSSWSAGIVDFDAVPFPNATKLIYEDFYLSADKSGTFDLTRVVSTGIENATWLDLWKAADQLIRASGDTHHVFVEDFASEERDGETVLILSTGS